MPFDGTNVRTIRDELAQLASVLRHPEKWPWYFKWDYRSPNCCGLELYSHLFQKHQSELWLHVHGMKYDDYQNIFFNQKSFGFLPTRYWVTPERVARAIDQYLVKTA